MNASEAKLFLSFSVTTCHISAKDAYSLIAEDGSFIVPKWWYNRLWNWHIPKKSNALYGYPLKIA